MTLLIGRVHTHLRTFPAAPGRWCCCRTPAVLRTCRGGPTGLLVGRFYACLWDLLAFTVTPHGGDGQPWSRVIYNAAD